nr:carotenoid oxygenase family protein [Waterburya agarophytonicola]
MTVRDAAGNVTTLPDDLTGHYFMVSPVGSPNSSRVDNNDDVVWVSKDGWTALYNGDGMVYRLSFTENQASLKTRIMKPPCYYADLATSDPSKQNLYGSLRFNNLGISRGSFNKLGIRNQLNTAFVPFKLADDESERLLVTWDVGRPYEVDPETLETLTPVGENEDWQDLLPDQQPIPFKNLMSSAHPVFDRDAERFYTLNVGKSLWTMFALPRSLKLRLGENWQALKPIIDDIWRDKDLSFTQSFQNILILIYTIILFSLQLVTWFLRGIVQIARLFRGGYDFVLLHCWDGTKVKIAKTWNVVLPCNKPLRIDQTVHQMGISNNYIVFAETSFKFSLENTMPFAKNPTLSSLIVFITDFLNYPQYPSTKLYIIDKKDLDLDENFTPQPNRLFFPDRFKHLAKVVATPVEIAPEFSHYVVDYDDTGDRLIIYAGHLAASDIAEYIRIYDRSAYDDRDRDDLDDIYDDPDLTSRLQQLAGNIVSPTDISRLGRLEIDAKTGKLIDHQMFPNLDNRDEINQQITDWKKDRLNNQIDPKYLLTWSTAFYVYPDRRPTRNLTDIFWNNWGAWPDTLTTRTLGAYEDYANRIVETDKVKDLIYDGVPSSLCHLQVIKNGDETTIQLNENNFYQFDKRNLGTSAQFIPRPNKEDQTDGYIVCAVLTSDRLLSQSTDPNNDPQWSQNSEIWIFDAQELNQGPLYKLSHPELNIGFSFHTTWLPEVQSPKRKLTYEVKKDYDTLVETLRKNQSDLSMEIRRLFDEEIYPNFE